MTFTWPSLALMLLALAGFLALELAWRHAALAPRSYLAWLAALTGVAFVAHLEMLRTDAEGALELETPSPHMHELFHYFLGTKYFPELGYDGLYRAAVLADYEDTPGDFRPELPMRDLATNRIIARGEVVPQADAIRARFAAARWAAFKRDVAVFRQASPEAWHARGPVIDHGYNGTPLVTAILGGLAAQPFLDTPAYLSLVSLLDPYWLALVAAAIAGLEGAATGLAFLFFAFANPLNEYGFTGGSYLRYDYLLALAAALVSLRQGWRATSGVLFAVAAGLRLFPAALYGCLLLRDLAGPGWRQQLRAGARLHLGFAAGALAILAVTSLVPTPDGRNAWIACAANMRKHTSAPSSNLVALSALVGYAPYKDRLVANPPRSETPTLDPSFDWIAETRRVLAERRWYHAASALALLAIALASLRGLGAAETLFPALLVVFAILPVTHYYWALLALVPLAAPRDHRVWIALAATCIAFAAGAFGLLDSHIDLRFALWSLEMMIFLLIAVVLCWRPPARVVAAALALAGCVALPLVGCGEKWKVGGGSHVPIDGNRYASQTFGFSIDKPAAWSFLPGSSLERDGDSRATDRWQRWEYLKKPARTPLISMAPSASPKLGVDPILRVFVIPISTTEGERGIEILTHTKADETVTTFAHNRGANPGFEILEAAKPVKVAGLEGAGIRLRYQLVEGEGAPAQPVEERLWHVRRGEEYWYFSQLGPDPLPDEMATQLEQILASARLDP